MKTKIGYCPVCDEEFIVYSDCVMCSCPYCGHHMMLHDGDD